MILVLDEKKKMFKKIFCPLKNLFTNFFVRQKSLVRHAAKAIKNTIHQQFVDQFVFFCNKKIGNKSFMDATSESIYFIDEF